LLEIFRPFDQRPSCQQPEFVYRPDIDPNVLETLSDSDFDDRTTFAEVLKDRMGGVDSGIRSESPEGEAAASCPKKPRTTVRKRKASAVIR